MPQRRSPRRGSMQYWPRVRAKSTHASIRTWPKGPTGKPLGFAGYKVGMTHVIVSDNRPNSLTKGEERALPVTLVECPPIRVFGARLYTKDAYGLHPATQIFSPSLDKHLSSALILPKKQKQHKEINPAEYHDLRLLVHTQPALTSIGKKKPELFELGLNGTTTEKYAYATSMLGKEITIQDVFAEGTQIDTHVITKGKGYQGPVKRFGVAVRHHKSEKTKRGPGNVGGWTGNRSFPVPHAGQMGYYQRMERNKLLLKITTNPKEVNPLGGFLRYGFVKNSTILIHGSVSGPAKRLIKMTLAGKPTLKSTKETLVTTHTSLASKQ